MKLAVYTGAKVSKAKGLSITGALIEGLPEGTLKTRAAHRPNHPTPNSAAMEALCLAIGVALSVGGTELEVFSSSKNVVRAVDGTGGAKYETRRDAILAAWVIYWKSGRATMTFVHRAAADMPDVAEHLAASMKGAEALLGAPQLALGV